MSGRGIARATGGVVLLAALGIAGGYLYASTSAGAPAAAGVPRQITASNPALPFTPPEKVNDDSNIPPLPTTLPTHIEKLGKPGHGGVAVPIPDGWIHTVLSPQEENWRPADVATGGYGVRIAVVDLRRSLAQVVAERAAALPFDPRLSDLQIIDESIDTLRASFILGGYRKLQITRWVSFDSNGIDLEISASGRLIDEQGMESLVANISSEATRLPAPRSQADGGARTPSATSSSSP